MGMYISACVRVCVCIVPSANPNSKLIASRHNPNKKVHTTILLSSSTVAKNSNNSLGKGEERVRKELKRVQGTWEYVPSRI